MALPIVDVTETNGKGIPVTEAEATMTGPARGTPVVVATNGLGTPVVYVESGGLPVVTEE